MMRRLGGPPGAPGRPMGLPLGPSIRPESPKPPLPPMDATRCVHRGGWLQFGLACVAKPPLRVPRCNMLMLCVAGNASPWSLAARASLGATPARAQNFDCQSGAQDCLLLHGPVHTQHDQLLLHTRWQPPCCVLSDRASQPGAVVTVRRACRGTCLSSSMCFEQTIALVVCRLVAIAYAS
jgi:hypothetical protein